MRNPQFDDHRIVWNDSYSGIYQPAPYQGEFEEQWRRHLEGQPGFVDHHGASTSDVFVKARVAELMAMFPVDYFQGKRCLDAGCGPGRWTRAMLSLGAQVTSIDVSPSSLASVRRYNQDVQALDLFNVASLGRTFDFVICWGVIMCTHDPAEAFRSVASAVAPGGDLYIMVYAPEGMHGQPENAARRKHYHRALMRSEDRLAYVTELGAPDNVIGWLDALNPFYNWVIPEDVVYDWYKRCSFVDVRTINADEHPRCGHHVVGKKA